MPARFEHCLEPTYGDRVDCEASGFGGAKAAGGDDVELGVCVEQSEHGYVGRKRGDEGFDNLLEGGDEVVAGNCGDRLLQGQVPPCALVEKMPGPNLVGEVDCKCDHDGAPAVGVDAMEGCAPPVRLLARGVVTELG